VSLGGIDEWLKSEICLADRQGLLTGRHLSVVQFQATYLLNWLDENEKSTARLQALKRSLIASGSWRPQDMFPEHFDDQKAVVDDDPDEELPPESDLDYSRVEWKSPTEAMGEYEALMAQVAQLSQGKLDEQQMRSPDDNGWR
jgi:hypothetical protein